VAHPDVLLATWLSNEADFATEEYAGAGREPVEVIDAAERPWLVLTAPHAVNHWRDGRIKKADRGTGGLVRTLCAALGCSGVIHARQLGPDPEPDDRLLVREALESRAGGAISLVDFHGMRDQRDLDVEVGLGQRPDEASLTLANEVIRCLERTGLRVACNERYQAASPHALTNWSRTGNVAAVQVELAARARPPLGRTDNETRVLSALLAALQQDR